MIVYFFLIVTTCAISVFRYKIIRISSTTASVLLSALIPSLISACRYGNGADYFLYERIFNTFCNGDIFFEVKSLEVGFMLLTMCCSAISESPFFFFLICALLINYFFIWGIYKMSPNVLFSILLFFITGTFFDTFNGLRQYIAASIVFCSYKFIIERNRKNFILTIIAASLFHYSALIMVPFYYLSKFRFNFCKACILLISEAVAGTTLYSIITYFLQYTRYSYFLTSVEYKIDITIGSILYTSVITLIAFIYLNNCHCRQDATYKTFLSLQVIICAISITSLFLPLSSRLQYYFLPFEIIIIPKIISSIRKAGNKIILASFFIFLYLGIVGTGMLFYGWFGAIPYKFYFG